MKPNKIFLLFITFLTLVCCDEKRVFDEYKSVGNSWNKDSIVSFKLPKFDATKKYNLFINLRNNNDYPFNNLFLIVAMKQPDKKTIIDTLEYEMANPDGTLMGEGFSSTKENKLFYKQKQFDLKGTYQVSIKHATRQSGKITGVTHLNGISEVGFRVESTN